MESANRPERMSTAKTRCAYQMVRTAPEMDSQIKAEPEVRVENGRRSTAARLTSFFLGTNFKLYCSYFLSSWGDRMWAFALSLALGVVGGDLMFTAASALANAAAVLAFGALIGSWIDHTSRLKAATICLIVNNISVAISAGILVVLLFAGDAQEAFGYKLHLVLIILSVVFCAISVLANMGTKICMTRDWIVVICAGDADKLAKLNGTMVSISLACLVISPLAVGQIMTSWGIGWGCVFVGVWNVCSCLFEYLLLLCIYKSCPALAVKSSPSDDHQQNANQSRDDSWPKCVGHSFRKLAVSFVQSYRSYYQQPVLPAGLALALLYVTVLSFDGVSIVYIRSLGLSESLIAVCQGVGAIMGIVGSVVYPWARKRVGVQRTGALALTWEWSCLLLPVASIWLPGSNFDPSAVFRPMIDARQSLRSIGCTHASDSLLHLSDSNNLTIDRLCNESLAFDQMSAATDHADGSNSLCSLIVFLTGVILSRFGLWMADLSISQLFQEDVVEHERGVVNGVQNALNNLMIIVISVVVIFLPDPRTFGILTMISWLAIFSGFCSYCFYFRSSKRNLLPIHGQSSRESSSSEDIKKPPIDMLAPLETMIPPVKSDQ